MAALSTALIVGSAVVGAGAAVAGTVQTRKAAKKQSNMLDDAETAAEELNKLDQTKDDTDSTFSLGRQDAAATVLPGTSPVATGTASTRTGSVKKRVGGLYRNTAKGVGL